MVEIGQLLQFVANGVSYGAILALGAIGLSLVYGILKLSNFAHGDMVALGAFATLFFARGLVGAAPPAWAYVPLVAIALVGLDSVTTRRLRPGTRRGAVVLAGALLAAWVLLYALGLVLPAAHTRLLLLPLALVIAVGLDQAWTRMLLPSERLVAGGFGVATLLVAGYVLATHGGLDARVPAATNAVLLLSCLVAVLGVAVLLLGTEAAIWRPLRRSRATTLTLIIVSIGLAIVIRNALQIEFTGTNQSFNRPGIPADRFFAGTDFTFQLTNAQQFTILAALVLIGGIHLYLKYTRAGKAMRALADNPDLARVTGVDVDRMVVYVWLIAATLVTVAGLLLTLVQNNQMNVNMGFNIIIPLFAAVILGGIGSAYGAMLGGFVVGIAMKTSALWLGTEYELASAFIILILVLIFRPQGILGVKT